VTKNYFSLKNELLSRKIKQSEKLPIKESKSHQKMLDLWERLRLSLAKQLGFHTAGQNKQDIQVPSLK
jgi:hypothetical protein